LKPIIVSIVGVRPHFIKAAVLSEVLRESFNELIIHTGQHYDFKMTQIFFQNLPLPEPDFFLNVGSMTHGAQTGLMLERIETILLQIKPSLVLVFGDANSTLAGCLASVKLGIPVGHVESGLRAYKSYLPEEINRVLTDHSSTFHFCPTRTAKQNLQREGINGAFFTGDVLYDAWGRFHEKAIQHQIPEIEPEFPFGLITLHRAHNTQPGRLKQITEALIQSRRRLIWPVHPRSRHALQMYQLWDKLCGYRNIRLIEPVGYFEMLVLEKRADIIITDSGGVQREAFFFRKPCLILRDNTEWPETLSLGGQVLVTPETLAHMLDTYCPVPDFYPFFGKGKAAGKIKGCLLERLV